MTLSRSCERRSPSAIATGLTVGTAPLRVNFTTGAKFAPFTVTTALAATALASSEPNDVAGTPDGYRRLAMSPASWFTVRAVVETRVFPD